MQKDFVGIPENNLAFQEPSMFECIVQFIHECHRLTTPNMLMKMIRQHVSYRRLRSSLSHWFPFHLEGN